MGRRRYYKRRRRKTIFDDMIDGTLSLLFESKTRGRSKKPNFIDFLIALGVMFLLLSLVNFEFSGFFSGLFTVLLWLVAIVATFFILSKLRTVLRSRLSQSKEEPPSFTNRIDVQVIPEEPEPSDFEVEKQEESNPKNAKVYNQGGSLNELLKKLRVNGIRRFNTLEDVRMFRNEYKSSIKKIKEKNKDALAQVISSLEKEYNESLKRLREKIKAREQELKEELAGFETELATLEKPSNYIERFIFPLKKQKILKRRTVLKSSFDEEVQRPFKKLISKVERLRSQIENRKNNPDKWVRKLSREEIQEQERILSVFVENKTLFYGAEGEARVTKELSKLPNTYYVINDYRVEFGTPIYNRKEDDRIYSIQIDHVVVGPTGIYFVETKNWSKASVESRDLRSPVKQLRRHSFAMFVLLNQAVENGDMRPLLKNWGGRKVSPQNLVVLMNHKPKEVFQYVNVLTVGEVKDHIAKNKVIFSTEEVESLVEYLDRIECPSFF